MNRTAEQNGVFQARGWLAAVAGASLLISVGLELYVQRAYGQVSLATMLLALYLASWAFVLGLIGLLIVSMWWLVKWGRLAFTSAPRAIPAPERTVLKVQEGTSVCG